MFKAEQKRNYDRRHQVRSLPILPEDQPVWVNMEGRPIPGIVSRQEDTPCSYLVETPSGQVRRNCSHLRGRSESSANQTETQPVQIPNPINTHLHSGTAIRPPDRLNL